MALQTFAALSGWAAAAVALTLAGIQFFIGRRQADAALTSAKAALMNAQSAGRHTVAEFRQKWIEKVIDTLSEHHSIIVTRGDILSNQDARRLAAARTRLEILLNPAESDTVELLRKLDDIVEMEAVKAEQAADMLMVARRLLKREWVRIKEELGSASTDGS